MLPACLLVTAYLCIPRAYLPAMQFASFLSVTHKADEKVAKRLGILIDASVSDVVGRRSPANLLNRICSGEACVYYFKHCDAQLACFYDVGELLADGRGKHSLVLNGFSITYKSHDVLMDAENRMYLAYGPERKRSYVKLSLLNSTAQEFPPSCSTLNPSC